MWWGVVPGFLVWAALYSLYSVRAEYDVYVNLRHHWHNYSDGALHAAPLLEMIEAVESVWPQHFFPIVSRVWSNDNLDHLTRASQKEVFEWVESAIRHYLTEQQVPHHQEGLDEWRINVAQHWSAARVEAHYQIFNTSREIQSLDPSCDTFVHLSGQILCSPEEAHTKLKLHAHGSPTALPHDHAYPVLHSSRSVVILYADPYSRSFTSFHERLMRLAEELPLTYVLRWRPSVATVEPRAYMPYISGFGTTLHLKKVDYLVLDDREVDVEQTTDDESQALDPLHELRSGLLDQLSLPLSSRLRTSVQEAVQTQANLSTTEFLYLGQATAKLILESKDPLSTLMAVASDFPVYATALSQYAATLSESDPIYAQLNDQSTIFVEPGYSQLWINGMTVSEEELDLQLFMERIQYERRLQTYFSAPELGISPDGVEMILTSPSITKAFGVHKSSILFYDVSDTKEAGRATGTPVIAWINDLEDGTYSGYPETIELMVEYRWFGSFPLVARNLFQLVVHIDLGDPEVLLFMNKILDRSLSAHAFRWGVVPLLVDEESETLAQVLWHATENLRPHEVSRLFKRLAQSPLNEAGRVDATRSRQILEQMISDEIKKEDDLLMSFVRENRTTPGSRLRLMRTRDYFERLYPVPRPDTFGMAYLNGQPVSLNENLYHELLQAVNYQLRLASYEIYSGRLDEDHLYESFYYTLRGTRASRSMLVTMLEEARMSLRPNKFVNMPQVFQRLGNFEQPLRHFVYASDDSLVSIRLVGDLDSQAMITQMAAALDAMRPGVESFRLSFIHTGSEDGFVARWLLSVMHAGTLSSISPQELSAALKSADREAALSRLSSEHETVPKELSWQPIASAFLLFSQMDHEAGITMLINGHILSDVSGFRTRDLEEALAWERAEHVDALLEAVNVPEGPPDVRSQVVEFGVSVVGMAFTEALDKGGALKPSQDRLPVALAMQARAGLTFSHGHPSSSIHVTAVLNPLDSKASHIASLLHMLASMAGVRLTVMMNPHLRVTSLPLQKFTRYDMRVTPEFDANGDEVAPVTVFQDLPATSVLTMQLHAPRTLVTMAEEALYDLDNLRLADVNGVMRAVYSVNSVLIEGHTRAEQEPTPRGLQLTLSTDDDSITLDTIVMETLGYFQFRSQPGRWKLSIRTGRSAELYEMETVGAWGWQSPSVHITGPDVVLDQLSGLLIFPVVRKRIGKERESLVADVTETGRKDLVNHVKSNMREFVSLLRGRKNPHADVNIFTIASGHLYERMTYIMILR